MDYNEANEVVNEILASSCLRPAMRRIGNGEYVVFVEPSGCKFYLWGMRDWEENKQRWKALLYGELERTP